MPKEPDTYRGEDIEQLLPDDDDPTAGCNHEWVYTGTAYGGDDERWHGEGRCYCMWCGTDGDG